MGFFSRRKPNIKVQTSKRDGFSGWLKCSNCKELIHIKELENSLNCCPKCQHHYRIPALDRIQLLADQGSFVEKFTELKPVDALNFVDSKTYPDRITQAQDKSRRDDAVIVGTCTIQGNPVALGVMDFSFMGGSMGSVVGERLTLLIEHATDHHLPLIIVATSGGARMQESILSLMQMAKTSAALARFAKIGLPYISVLTNPTSGGVTASFATLGDIIIAEPGALICFAGPRVIEQTIGEKLPPGAQQSEFVLKHGMIDCIVARHELADKLAEFVEFFSNKAENSDSNSKESLQTPSKQMNEGLPKKLQELMSLPDHETQ